jgi:hypothetical protein
MRGPGVTSAVSVQRAPGFTAMPVASTTRGCHVSFTGSTTGAAVVAAGVDVGRTTGDGRTAVGGSVALCGGGGAALGRAASRKMPLVATAMATAPIATNSGSFADGRRMGAGD